MKTNAVIGAAILLLVAIGLFVYYHFPNTASPIPTQISEGRAAELAGQAFINSAKTALPATCVSADPVSTTADSILFDLREIHNVTCGGDPNTSPRLGSVTVNLQTGATALGN